MGLGRPAGLVAALESLGASAYLVAAAIGLASLLGEDVIAMSWPSNVVVAERKGRGKKVPRTSQGLFDGFPLWL